MNCQTGIPKLAVPDLTKIDLPHLKRDITKYSAVLECSPLKLGDGGRHVWYNFIYPNMVSSKA
jgi:hypothetical protein